MKNRQSIQLLSVELKDKFKCFPVIFVLLSYKFVSVWKPTKTSLTLQSILKFAPQTIISDMSEEQSPAPWTMLSFEGKNVGGRRCGVP